jgi:Flp pilus assembly protein CpaB
MPTLSKNIIISIVLAVAAAAALVIYMSQVRDQAASGERNVQVVVATQDIHAGTPVDDAIATGDFGTRTVRAADAPAAAISDLDSIRGEVVTQELFRGDTVTANRLGRPHSQGAGAQVTGNYRLISVPLYGTQGLLSSLQPSDRVDIFADTSNADGTQNFEQLIVPGALVVGITPVTDTSSSSTDQGSVLLSMTEQQAGQVAAALAGDSGGKSDNNIWLALVGRTGATYRPFVPVPLAR